MKSICTFISCFLLVIASHAQANKINNARQIQQIDSVIQSLITNKKSAGFMLGIQVKDEKPFFKEYGVTDVQTQDPVKPSSIFRIASVTKPITATAIMCLIEKGQLSLTDRLSKFFKDFPNGDKITIYNLLSHTSGIPNWWDGGMPSNEPKDFPMCPQPHLYLQHMKNTSFFEVGTKHAYSNSGYVLLGEIIEIVSGMSYEKYLQNHIFNKVGMKNTMVEKEENANANWVKGYKQNSPTDTVFSAPDVYAMPFAAGALRSNTIDLLQFMNSLHSGKLIKRSNVKAMQTSALTSSGIPVYDAVYFPKDITPPTPPTHIKNMVMVWGLA
jgi:D-alanyl-D-alanine carboxypeptidase